MTGIASAMDADTQEEVEAILDTLPDPAGYFYRFHLAAVSAAPPGPISQWPQGDFSRTEPV